MFQFGVGVLVLCINLVVWLDVVQFINGVCVYVVDDFVQELEVFVVLVQVVVGQFQMMVGQFYFGLQFGFLDGMFVELDGFFCQQLCELFGLGVFLGMFGCFLCVVWEFVMFDVCQCICYCDDLGLDLREMMLVCVYYLFQDE